LPFLAFLAGLLFLIAIALVLRGRDREEAPASRAVLDRIATKNREAATVSAETLRAQSRAAVASADTGGSEAESGPAVPTP
jgi:hypothetical protein